MDSDSIKCALPSGGHRYRELDDVGSQTHWIVKFNNERYLCLVIELMSGSSFSSEARRKI